ncbi:sulfite exporter TauE/SafE family protein [Tyzzerella sp. An114]|uniref:sulfite exporter TauE/SafE family protein n=1 Tax=Tyzzerella sp. An114 TaxID=1965545 RepID=UPI001FA82461|nr:sulfite exporter TauE/SafE family protein [Tyzzerella sp. An114]
MKNIKMILIGLATGLANGLFGSGGGTIAVPFMEKFLNIDAHKSHGTAIALILPLSVISAFVYIFNTQIPLWETIFISIGGILGGFTGAKIMPCISAKFLHVIFGGFMIFAGVRMIL